MAKNQFAYVKAKVRDLRGAGEDLQLALRRLTDSEAEITGLHELFQKDKHFKRLISYNEILDSAASSSDNSGNDHRRRH